MTDAGAVCKVASEAGALTIVDCVTSLGGVPVEGSASPTRHGEAPQG